MKSIKEKAKEHSLEPRVNAHCGYDEEELEESFEVGANYVLDAITECMPKTHSFNPNEVIDIITSKIKELKK